jgi:G3E family GTPase
LIPVTLITGFLGSGKTTLLRHLLGQPEMARTAIILNEFGEIPLDHDLIETSDESFIQLTNGCLCCRVRSDLQVTLVDLAARRAAGSVPEFDRVAIETTGLADPAPILQTLTGDPLVSEIYALENVVTTVDAVTGLSTLERHEEALRQAAVADRLLITKIDLEDAQPQALATRLRAFNPGAALLQLKHGIVGASAIIGPKGQHAPDLRAWLAHHGTDASHRHGTSFESFCIVRDEPVHAVALSLFLAGLSENLGANLLRMKGIVNVLEEPDRPAVVHGVQHVYFPPEWLARWPSDDRRTRMVFIGRSLPEGWIRTLLDLLDSECAEFMSPSVRPDIG